MKRKLKTSYDGKEIENGRRELAEKIRDFAEKYGAETSLGVDPDKPDEVDRFATALIEYGMIHRVR